MTEIQPVGIFEQWKYRILVEGDSIAQPVIGLPAFLIELLKEAQWTGCLTNLQEVACNAVVTHLKVEFPELLSCADMNFFGVLLGRCHDEAASH